MYDTHTNKLAMASVACQIIVNIYSLFIPSEDQILKINPCPDFTPVLTRDHPESNNLKTAQ